MPRSLTLIMNQRCMKRKKLKIARSPLFGWLKGRTVEAKHYIQQARVCKSSASITVYEFIITVWARKAAPQYVLINVKLSPEGFAWQLDIYGAHRGWAGGIPWHQIVLSVGATSAASKCCNFRWTRLAHTHECQRDKCDGIPYGRQNDEPWNPSNPVTFRSRLLDRNSF